jgi:hypothetical protein
MTDRHHHDPAEHAELTEQDLAIAALVGRYIERREHHQPPCVHDLLAAAKEFGDAAVDVLRTLLASYEAMRAYDDSDPCRSGNPAAPATQLRSTL